VRKKHTPIAAAKKLWLEPQTTNLFDVRSQSLRLFLPHTQFRFSINPLIPGRFGGQCAMINGGLAVEKNIQAILLITTS
jgi:hypothetical protein